MISLEYQGILHRLFNKEKKRKRVRKMYVENMLIIFYKDVTPTQFWRFFREDEFESDDFELIGSGNFSQVKKAKFKNASYLQSKNKPITHAAQYVVLKVKYNV